MTLKCLLIPRRGGRGRAVAHTSPGEVLTRVGGPMGLPHLTGAGLLTWWLVLELTTWWLVLGLEVTAWVFGSSVAGDSSLHTQLPLREPVQSH